MYADYTDYQNFYGMKRLQEADFMQFAIKAQKILDHYTTGVDNVKKLKIAFPTDEDSVLYVKACFCDITDMLYEISEAEKMAGLARGFESTADGIRGKVITSRSAGNESISYSASGGTQAATEMDKAVADPDAKARMINDVVTRYLSGVTDANGVNLMYMGRYPCIRTP